MGRKSAKNRNGPPRGGVQQSMDPYGPGQMLGLAYQHHQAGRLQEADALYAKVLKQAPGQPDALHLRGLLALQAGELERGVTLLRKAVKANPASAEVRINLGNALKESGDGAAAAKEYVAALKHNPTIPELHNNLGAVYFEQGDLEAARQHFEEALRLRPEFNLSRYMLGKVELAQGNLDQAIELLRAATQDDDASADAWLNLAMAISAKGNHFGSLPYFRKAIELNPANVVAYTHLGGALQEMGRDFQAVEAYEKALELAPDDVQIKLSLANARKFSGDIHGALEQLDDILARHPKLVPALVSRGDALKNLGRHDEAIEWFDKARELAPANPGIYMELANAKKYAQGDPLIARMEEIVSNQAPGESARASLHFALGKIYGDAKDFDKSFEHYAAANAEVRRSVDYSPENTVGYIDRLIATYTPELFQKFAGMGSDSQLPVFIVGMPRSGTTLTEQIISSHPQAGGAGELGDFARMVQVLPIALNSSQPYPDCVAKLTPEVVGSFSKRYLRELLGVSEEAKRVTDKMPGNYFNLGLISILFPQARIIHTRRNPQDTCLSIFFQHFRGHHDYSHDLRELGLHYRQYLRLMEHWKRVLPVSIFDVRYEELVADQEAVSRRMLEYIGLPWDDACLQFHKTERTVQTASHWQVRQPIYKSSSGRWRRYESHLGPLIEALGEAAEL